jgi:hypothetical protein
MSEVPLISIVDDDALARDGIRELVESLGYKAIAFASAQHFLASRVARFLYRVLYWRISDVVAPSRLAFLAHSHTSMAGELPWITNNKSYNLMRC